jgi:hypothetical protein
VSQASAHYVSKAFRACNVLRLGFATAALRSHQPPSFIGGSIKYQDASAGWPPLKFFLSALTFAGTSETFPQRALPEFNSGAVRDLSRGRKRRLFIGPFG